MKLTLSDDDVLYVDGVEWSSNIVLHLAAVGEDSNVRRGRRNGVVRSGPLDSNVRRDLQCWIS